MLAFGEPSFTYRQIERHKSIAFKKKKTFVCMCVGMHAPVERSEKKRSGIGSLLPPGRPLC